MRRWKISVNRWIFSDDMASRKYICRQEVTTDYRKARVVRIENSRHRAVCLRFSLKQASDCDIFQKGSFIRFFNFEVDFSQLYRAIMPCFMWLCDGMAFFCSATACGPPWEPHIKCCTPSVRPSTASDFLEIESRTDTMLNRHCVCVISSDL